MISGKQAAAVALILIIAIPILAGFAFATETTTKTVLEVDDNVSVSELLLNDETYYYNTYEGPNNNNLLLSRDSNGITFNSPHFVVWGTTASSVPLGSTSSTTFAVTEGEYVSFSTFAHSSFYFSTDAEIALLLTYADGTTEEIWSGVGYECLKSGGTLQVKEPGFSPTYVYNLLSDVSVKLTGDNSLTMYYFQAAANLRGDPAYGWSVPGSSYGWANGYSNSAVTFYLHMDVPEDADTTVTIEPTPGLIATGIYEIDFTMSTDGTMTVTPDYDSRDTYTVGAYTDVQIVYDLYNETVTVSGISAFPNMGTSPNLYESVEFPTPEQYYDDTFEMIVFSGDTDAVWRCDKASVIGGTFPATVDYTLDMVGLFPGKDVRLNLRSIGIYGDSLTIAGTNYEVTDGTIQVDGETVSLRGATVQIVIDTTSTPHNYVTSVNGKVVNTRAVTSGQPTVTFNGVWGLTATVDLLTEAEQQVEEWAPGEFAFDKDSFILMIIFAAAAVFVALGFTAGRSGGKVLLLAVACGGASVIALMLV